MEKRRLEEFKAGWILGNFSPSMNCSESFEFGVKRFVAGESEAAHYQRIANEISVVIHGECRIGPHFLSAGDILFIEPNEIADFEAFSNCSIAVVKWPSIPSDKVLV